MSLTDLLDETFHALGTLDGFSGPSGSYIDRGTVRPSAPASYDHDREESLWRAVERSCSMPPT